MTRMITGGAIAAALWLALGAQTPMSQSRLIGYQVTFLITQNPKSITNTTSDQLTIVFASRSVEGARPPRPIFGEDIIQEFSFSGQDFVNNQVRFSRRVNDKSFLEARYIRVINHGVGGWDGDTISLTVDGQDILRNVRMTPRSGNSSKGFQNFNPRNWAGRSFWEAEFAKIRAYGAYGK